MNADDTQAWPSELRLHKDRKTLTVTFAGLDFVPIVWEPFDLLMRQRDYFHPPMQALIRFLQSDELRTRAQ